ncbi:MAG TPA: serine/threonine-protein kinase [Streptosporangiaceae bacterium]|nr:serine/threonine-protein kinase [Streptosporangiaceae bacterium]
MPPRSFGRRSSLARTPLRPDDPTRIGHYRLTARLGSGGMGVVYLGVAWDGAPVAVKVLRPDLADDEEFRRRFGREVSALVQVKGECTVRVIEADSQSATPFVVTEYAPGPSLSEYMDKQGTVGGEMLFGLATGLAEALTVIHAAGIMHRDLKPSNIILTDAGPKVIDFGIARRQQDTSAVTKAGMMIGSMGFMAPEQITGNPGPEADVFAWGVTVAYAATGRSPFGSGSTHSILYQIMYGDADTVMVPDSLRPLVESALLKDPQRRPTARQLLDRLTSASPQLEQTSENPTQLILRRTWQSGTHSSPPSAAASPAAAPAASTPPADAPSARTPSARTPSARTPSARTPSARTPVSDPGASIPAEARWILARQPTPPSQASPAFSPASEPAMPAPAPVPVFVPATTPPTEPPTADGPAPDISALVPQPSAPAAAAPEAPAKKRRMARWLRRR